MSTETKSRSQKAISKTKAVIVFLFSPEGRKDIGAVIAFATALYTVIHRAGV